MVSDRIKEPQTGVAITMGLETDLTGILREVVQFLESLREAKLPVTLENVRENLLMRSKCTLTAFSSVRRSASPEPYLNMNAGSKGLHLIKSDSDLQEYVGVDEPKRQSVQDYYVTFPDVEEKAKVSAETPVVADERDGGQEMENALVDIYASLSAAQTKSKCHKCGPLFRKEGKKLFVFEQHRACWVGLVGSHLLIYGSERDNRPYIIQSVKGYMGRPAPNAIPRDSRRSESAFEIFSPGSKTLQFIARTPKDMEQWVAKICQIGCGELSDNLNNSGTFATETNAETKESSPKSKLDRKQDPNSLMNDSSDEQVVLRRSPVPEKVNDTKSDAAKTGSSNKKTEASRKIEGNGKSDAPPLPARIPRRLPSLPSEEAVPNYEPMEEEEDDIYYRIEDFCGRPYQNMMLAKKSRESNAEEKLPTYDDVRAPKKVEDEAKKKTAKEADEQKKKNVTPPQETAEAEETYDDIGAVLKEGRSKEEKRKKQPAKEEPEEQVSYDDAQTLGIAKPAVSPAKPKKEEPTKSPQKKSFLNRVRSRKDSPRKAEKKAKRKTPTPPPLANEELPMYDDVAELMRSRELPPKEEEMSEYNCPPPPRPIYVKSPASSAENEEEELYDDVAECRARYKEEESKKNVEQQLRTKGDSPGRPIEMERKTDTEEAVTVETEHYQSPRSDACQRPYVQEEEELYDDIAILADFTAKQRELALKSAEASKPSSSPEKKPWNRFVSSRKSRSSESANVELNRRSCNEPEDDCFDDQQGLGRMNTFQKLINKMENSLGKASNRGTPSLSATKMSPGHNIT